MTIKVFIADDHAVVRDGLRVLLEANSAISVVGDVGNGQEAVSQVQQLRPDVVIMDISMPGLNGIDATGQILASLPQIRVIILSMVGTPEHVFRALQAGASGYLLKESAGREVMEAVLAVAAGQVYLSQPITQTLIADYLHRQAPAPTNEPLGVLSERERQILVHVVAGKTSAEIGQLLFLSPKTVESYRSRMMRKLDVPDLPSLIKLAIQAGL
jgi:DNA-binding NarL/FixJ family response regulator